MRRSLLALSLFGLSLGAPVLTGHADAKPGGGGEVIRMVKATAAEAAATRMVKAAVRTAETEGRLMATRTGNNAAAGPQNGHAQQPEGGGQSQSRQGGGPSARQAESGGGAMAEVAGSSSLPTGMKSGRCKAEARRRQFQVEARGQGTKKRRAVRVTAMRRALPVRRTRPAVTGETAAMRLPSAIPATIDRAGPAMAAGQTARDRSAGRTGIARAWATARL
jgi:hypothetical protein